MVDWLGLQLFMHGAHCELFEQCSVDGMLQALEPAVDYNSRMRAVPLLVVACLSQYLCCESEAGGGCCYCRPTKQLWQSCNPSWIRPITTSASCSSTAIRRRWLWRRRCSKCRTNSRWAGTAWPQALILPKVTAACGCIQAATNLCCIRC